MAKRYIVDLRSLDLAERKASYDLIDSFSFMTDQIMGETGLEGADVIWNSNSELEMDGCEVIHPGRGFL